jgi:hypothetical protein
VLVAAIAMAILYSAMALFTLAQLLNQTSHRKKPMPQVTMG